MVCSFDKKRKRIDPFRPIVAERDGSIQIGSQATPQFPYGCRCLPRRSSPALVHPAARRSGRCSRIHGQAAAKYSFASACRSVLRTWIVVRRSGSRSVVLSSRSGPVASTGWPSTPGVQVRQKKPPFSPKVKERPRHTGHGRRKDSFSILFPLVGLTRSGPGVDPPSS